MSDPLISVVMPVYRAEATVVPALFEVERHAVFEGGRP